MRLGDLDELWKKVTSEYDDFIGIGDFLEICESMSTVDAEPIVRCKDCKHHEHSEPGMVWCPFIEGSWIEDDFFCAYGSRREVTE